MKLRSVKKKETEKKRKKKKLNYFKSKAKYLITIIQAKETEFKIGFNMFNFSGINDNGLYFYTFVG